MKKDRFYIFVVLFLWSVLTCPAGFFFGQNQTAAAAGGFTFINQLQYVPNGGSATSGTLDCTGADLILVWVGSFNAYPASAVVDSAGNNYTAGTLQTGTNACAQVWYKKNPTGSLSALTFTATIGTTSYAYYGIQAFSGGSTSTIDQQSGANGSAASSYQPGSITPTQNNALVTTAVFCYNQGGTPSISSPTMTSYGSGSVSGGVMGGNGWVVQGTAAAINPTWTGTSFSGGGNFETAQASFIP